MDQEIKDDLWQRVERFMEGEGEAVVILRDGPGFRMVTAGVNPVTEINRLKSENEALRVNLEIAIEEHDCEWGKSNDPCHWTNEARQALQGAKS